ncbi:hypothetical protein EZV62_006371 [Acer yangbiense]|uniref:Uncharacterized protein n=1 Tax=Acer yangbiense TaxID=1000413 RepID=A0A5C7I9P4_9ROSI|nr:hypothetical protein EZV62_006371 [Acer yangbiense]
MDSMLSSQSMEVSGAAVNVLALRLQESSQTTQFSIDQIPQSSQQVNLQSCISSAAVYAMLMNILIGQFTGNLRQTLIKAFGYTEALGHDGSDSSHFGLTLHLMHAIPLNKKLYTFSYVCLTSGAALVFSAIYALLPWELTLLTVGLKRMQVDIWDLKYMFLPLEQIGMNAMLVYLMSIWDSKARRVDRLSTLCYLGKDFVLSYDTTPRVPSSGLMPASDVLIRAKESEEIIRTAMRRPFYMDGTRAKEFGVIDMILWHGQESIIADVGAPEEWDKKASIKSVDGL